MANIFTDSLLINVLVSTLAEFLSSRLGKKVVGKGLGKNACYTENPNNTTATFRFEEETDNLCSLEHGPTDGESKVVRLKLVLSPYLKGINRSVYDELETILNTDIGIRRPVNRDDD